MRTILWLIVGMSLLALPTISIAQESPKVVVSPMVYVAESESVDAIRGAALDGANTYLNGWREVVSPVEESQFRRRVTRAPNFEQSRRIGEKWVQIGLTEYKNLKTADAIESLEQAVSTFETINFVVIDRKAYANALQYLALSYLDDPSRPNPARSLELMKRMLRSDPSRGFKQGLFPAHVVDFFESSRRSLERDLSGNGPDVQEARATAAAAGADYVLYLSVLPDGAGFDVVLQVFERKTGTYLPLERVSAASKSPEDIQEAANQVVSRFVTCIMTPVVETQGPVERSRGESPWSMELNFAYASFLGFPADEVVVFGNYGASVGASYLITREFAVLGMAQVLTSLRDQDGYLVDDFTTLRGFAGVSLGYSFGPVRTELGTLAEFATLSDVVVCNSPQNIVDCDDAGESDTYEFSALAGLTARPKVTLQLLTSLRLTLSGSATFYIFPLSDRQLNFPLTVESGFEYRF